MAGSVAQSLTAAAPRVRFELARPADDADIRRLLRQNAMPGRMAFTMEREPSYFAAAEAEGGEHRTLMCRGTRGELLGIGTSCVRPMMVRGRDVPVAYLSQLRLTPAGAGRRDVIVNGYRAMGELCGNLPCFTSIMADNTRARRLLESGLRGLPKYALLTEFDTFVLGRVRAARDAGIRVLSVDRSMLDRVHRVLCEHAIRRDLAPCWTIDALRRAMDGGGVRMYLAMRDDQDVGCIGAWDQRQYKQVVVRGYSTAMLLARPFVSAGSRLFGWPQLPRLGETLALQYFSHIATVKDDNAVLAGLIAAAARDASQDGCTLIGGCATGQPFHDVLKQFAWMSMRSRIYSVSWGNSPDVMALPPGSDIHLEIAQL